MNRHSKLALHDANLDFIRALAVLAVVSAHLSLFLGNLHLGFFEISLLGRLGVAVFFVHSGIVNLLSLERQAGKQGEAFLFRTFMIRRCFRIYPLSVAVVSVIYLLQIPVAHIEKWGCTLGNHPHAELIPSLLLVQNFVQFDQILDPLWSLPFELQTYCFFPWIYRALRRFNSAGILLFVWAVLVTVDHVVAPRIAKHGKLGQIIAIPDMLYFFLWFLAGVIAYKQMQTSERRLPFWTLPALLAFLSLACLLSYDRNKFIFIALCLGLALPHIQDCKILGLNRVCAWVAKYSFGIYLLHAPAIWLGFVRMRHIPWAAQAGIFLLTAFGGSYVLYHAIEHPMIVRGNKLAAVFSRKNIPARIAPLAVAAGGGR
jgi:peptidoglycan/LPS O-acetylase OafA/YrhL